MSNNMLFYREIEALSRELHADLKLEPLNKYDFVKEMYWAPLAGTEFFEAAKNYPVVFLKNDENFIPIALLGLQDQQNLFVEDNGDWPEEIYIPAFIRRYPFVLAETGKDDEQLTVCIDKQYAGFNQKKGQELFTKEGENSKYLENILNFLMNYNADMQRTRDFVGVLLEKELLESKVVTIEDGKGETFDVHNIYLIDEAKFREVDAATLEQLNNMGMLGWVFAHFYSMNNFPMLYDLFKKRNAVKKASAKTAAKAPKKAKEMD